MKRKWIAALGLLVALSGCRTVQQSLVPTGRSVPQPIATNVSNQTKSLKPAKQVVRQVAFQEDDTLQEESSGLILAQELATEPITSSVPFEYAGSTSLPELEQTALAVNPAVAEIQAEIESLRGKLTQAGLPPNPRVGINAEDIFEDGSAGRYGVFFGREVVRGNKLGRSRSVVCAEIEAVQSEVELENAKVVQRQAENRQLAARRKLAGLLGESELLLEYVSGNPREILAMEDFEQSYDQLVISSPEVAALFAEVEQRRRQLNREIVKPIPNVTWQTTIQYDTVSDSVVGGFQVGLPIPTLNRNQGAIHQARHQIVAAERRAEKKALDLRQRLAGAYESYLDAKLQVDAYDSEIIPKAKKTLDLVTKGYQEGEIDFLQLLTAQRTYSQINLTYLQQLQQVWRQNVEIKGMLLSDSLQ